MEWELLKGLSRPQKILGVVSVRCLWPPVLLMRDDLRISIWGRDRVRYIPPDKHYYGKYAQILFVSKGPTYFYQVLGVFKAKKWL